MLVLANTIHEKYFYEFINSLLFFSSKCSINNPNNNFLIHLQSNNYIDKDTVNIIFNTEQLTIDNWKNKLKELSSTFPILDYSYENIKILYHLNNNSKLCLFPILFNKDLMHFNYNCNDCDFDVVFIGCLTQRRLFILNQLYSQSLKNEKQIKIKVIDNTYDFNQKYNEIFKGKILLNIHAFDDYKIFEYARCSIPVFNSQIVISENSLDVIKDAGEINEFVLSKIIFSSYDEIVNKTIEVLNNIDEYKYKIDYSELELKTNKEMERINNFFNSF